MAWFPFGNYYDELTQGPPGPPGAGFKLTPDGHYDMEGKKLRNCENPDDDADVVTKGYTEEHCLSRASNAPYNARGKRIKNVGDPLEPHHVVNKNYADEKVGVFENALVNYGNRLEKTQQDVTALEGSTTNFVGETSTKIRILNDGLETLRNSLRDLREKYEYLEATSRYCTRSCFMIAQNFKPEKERVWYQVLFSKFSSDLMGGRSMKYSYDALIRLTLFVVRRDMSHSYAIRIRFGDDPVKEIRGYQEGDLTLHQILPANTQIKVLVLTKDQSDIYLFVEILSALPDIIR